MHRIGTRKRDNVKSLGVFHHGDKPSTSLEETDASPSSTRPCRRRTIRDTRRRPGPKYAIIPGDFVGFTDEAGNRPRLVHYRVLLYLAMWTDPNGRFKRSVAVLQSDMAKEAGLSRQKFCSALQDLIKWGFVEEIRSADDKRLCSYRVLMHHSVPQEPEGEDAGQSPCGDRSPSGSVTKNENSVTKSGEVCHQNPAELCHHVVTPLFI